MMHTSVIQRTSWVIIALLGLLVGCKKSTDSITAATPECQLQSVSTTSNGLFQQATVYTYNDNGQLVKSVQTAHGLPVTYTYAYDAAGNMVSSVTQGTIADINFTSTGAYEYTNGRLTKITALSSSTIIGTGINTYSYDDAGRLATYTYSAADANYGTESYTFTSGMLTSGSIVRAGQSVTLTVANGRVTAVLNSNGSQSRSSYDANGYLTRTDSFDKAGGLQSYTVYEYSPTAYKKTSTPYRVIPTLEVYGSQALPLTRSALYNADGSLKAETRYQREVNSQGYLSSSGYVQNTPGISPQGMSTTTYTYNNCQ